MLVREVSREHALIAAAQEQEGQEEREREGQE
jgi:hypothetical protein